MTPPAVPLPRNVRRRENFLALVRGQRRGLWPSVLRGLLRVASWGYGLAAWANRLRYDRGWAKVSRAAVPVVSIGNLTVGGTGKTPCVEYVARHYRGRGLLVAILSRGYGADSGPNDEALVLEENLPDVPHLQGADRSALAASAVEELESEILLLDDGMQHRRLHRDLELVLLDATDPWGQGHLLPRGLLREPVSSLRRADAVVLTRCDQVSADAKSSLRAEVSRRAPRAVVAETVHAPEALVDELGRPEPLDGLRGATVVGLCGIGNPAAFGRTLADAGATVAEMWAYPDHHAYTREDVDALRQRAKALPAGSRVVTTQKDMVKLRLGSLADKPLRALRIALRCVSGEADLLRLLDRVPQDAGTPDTPVKEDGP